jgi:hypothetical protein
MRVGRKWLKRLPAGEYSPHQSFKSLMSHDEHDEDSHQSPNQ